MSKCRQVALDLIKEKVSGAFIQKSAYAYFVFLYVVKIHGVMEC